MDTRDVVGRGGHRVGGEPGSGDRAGPGRRGDVADAGRRGRYASFMAHSTQFVIPRPTSGDIVDVIIDDHRVMEALLRDVRNASLDRDGARKALATLLVAHSEAEEEVVYPALKRKTEDVGDHEANHGEEEHAEGLVALTELFDAKGTDTKKFDDAAEKVSNYLYHHFVEEELTILNPARTELGDAQRAEIGARFLAARSRLLDEDCGDEANVRALVAKAVKDGTIESTDIPDAPAD